MSKPHVFGPLLGQPATQRLMNGTRGIMLAARIETAFDSRSRRTGLLGRSGLPHDTALAIAPSNAVHTFGMHFSIDVLFVRRNGEVLKRVLDLKPGRIAGALRAFAVLEFAAGHAGVSATRVGDRLSIESLLT